MLLGMDLVAVVSTDRDVWQLKVRGQLMNETWSNIGIRWEPYDESRVRIFKSFFVTVCSVVSVKCRVLLNI